MDVNNDKPNNNEADLWLAAIKDKPEFSSFVTTVVSNPEMIGVLLEIIRKDKGSTKFYCDKVIRKVSEMKPSLVYPYFKEIAQLIDSTNNFIKWGALLTISNLIPIDQERRFDAIYDKYFDLINSDSMITAATVAGNAWKFVQSWPEKENDITARMLRVLENTYLNKGKPSLECKNILIGHVIECFDKYFEVSGNQNKILEFVGGQKDNNRKSTAKKAAAFLKKHSVA